MAVAVWSCRVYQWKRKNQEPLRKGHQSEVLFFFPPPFFFFLIEVCLTYNITFISGYNIMVQYLCPLWHARHKSSCHILMTCLTTHQGASLRKNSGVRNKKRRGKRINGVARTSLISTWSFSFDPDRRMECQSLKYRKWTQRQGEVGQETQTIEFRITHKNRWAR